MDGGVDGGSSSSQRFPGGATLVDKITLIKKCYDEGELLEALELTRHELETHSSAAILHRLYAKYLKDLEVSVHETDLDGTILKHAKKAVSLFPNSTEYRYFYGSLLYDDVRVSDKKVIKQCKLALGDVDRSEEPYWRFYMNDGAKVDDVIDGVRDLMLKARRREERRRLKGEGFKMKPR